MSPKSFFSVLQTMSCAWGRLSCLLLLLAGFSLSSAAQNLLPLPRKMITGKGKFVLDRQYRVVNEAGETAENLYLHHIISASLNEGRRTVTLRTIEKRPSASAEAYRLHVTPDSMVIEASSREGFIRAGQTLFQLSHAAQIPACEIEDEPSMAWRGCMIDVSRHFFPLETLFKQIDILARYKINVLHLHLTDSGGWRMEMEGYPRLTSLGAWRTHASWDEWWGKDKKHLQEGTPGAYGGYYTKDELRQLVKYAEERGITIVPEIEFPGHAREVLVAYPEFSCRHAEGFDPENPASSDLCPGNEGVYSFMENVIQEVMEVFPSEYIHVGGDEADMVEWKTCLLCQQKMKELGTKEVHDLQAYLMDRLGKFLQSKGRKLIGWDEIIHDSLSPSSAVMLWRDLKDARKAMAMGCDVVLTPSKYCYLDYYQDAPYSQPKAFGGFITLNHVYSYKPFEGLTETEAKHVKGLQGNLWTEYVETPQHLEYMLYPRMLAIAETAWLGNAKPSYEHFWKRATTEIDHLGKLGVQVFDVRKEKGNRKESRRIEKHLAWGAKVTYNVPLREQYSAAGETTLTDGWRGGWHHNDGKWQGFAGDSCVDVTVDLGMSKRFSSVAIDFIQNDGAWIYLPESLTISVSEDGKQFKELTTINHPKTPMTSVTYRQLDWKGKASARYINVKAHATGKDEWIFMDEIRVK